MRAIPAADRRSYQPAPSTRPAKPSSGQYAKPKEWTLEPLVDLQTVADYMGLTRQRVHQLEMRAIRKIVAAIVESQAIRDDYEEAMDCHD